MPSMTPAAAGDVQLPESSVAPPAVDSGSPPSDGFSASKSTLMVLGVGIAIGVVLMLFCVGIFFVWRKRRNRSLPCSTPPRPKDDYCGHQQHQWGQNTPLSVDNVGGMLIRPGILPNSRPFSDGSATPPPPSTCSSLSSERPLHGPSPDVTTMTFSYEELALASNNFDSANLLGQGGFGYVFKGVIQNGKEVAIKQLKIGSGQGEREFQAEVETISRVHHKHLVSLVGYCTSGDQRLLVYEFVPNKTLAFHLHGKDHSPINWAHRVKIAQGSAKGLAFLHEECHPKIIHRDIKASNILIDDDFEAKVADFGLARFYPDSDTHVSTRVMGTFGYLAPEYALTGKLTEKSDVFSFGVMLLELITGRRPIDKAQHYIDHNIVDWARPLLTQALEDGNFGPLVDPRLQKEYDFKEMARMVVCAAVCVRHLARRRPRMGQIVRALEGKITLEELNEDIRPGHGTKVDSYVISECGTAQYKEDMKKFQKMVLESEAPDSSQSSSRQTGDFGLSTTEEMNSTNNGDLVKKKKLKNEDNCS